MFSAQNTGASAVLFFAEQRVVKELLYSEFEAMLDGYTPEAEWAGRTASAAYLELSPELSLQSAVFFEIGFDDEGWVSNTWNTPLTALARNAESLNGSDSLKVMTANRCEDPHYRDLLWDPDLSDSGQVIPLIEKTLAANRLGLTKESSRQRNASKASKHSADENAGEAKNNHTKADSATEEPNAVKGSQAFAAMQHRIESLEASLKAKDRHIAELKDYYEHKLEHFKSEESEYFRALRDHYEGKKKDSTVASDSTEANDSVELLKKEYEEQINWREVEVMYRAEREAELYKEMSRLQMENAELKEADAENLLQTLSEKGIAFVTYQVGLGSLSIPADDIPLYMANPIAYVAAYCNVTEAIYLEWLAHYHAPVCRASTPDGGCCGKDIPPVDSPENYMPGVSDRCAEHRHQA